MCSNSSLNSIGADATGTTAKTRSTRAAFIPWFAGTHAAGLTVTPSSPDPLTVENDRRTVFHYGTVLFIFRNKMLDFHIH